MPSERFLKWEKTPQRNLKDVFFQEMAKNHLKQILESNFSL